MDPIIEFLTSALKHEREISITSDCMLFPMILAFIAIFWYVKYQGWVKDLYEWWQDCKTQRVVDMVRIDLRDLQRIEWSDQYNKMIRIRLQKEEQYEKYLAFILANSIIEETEMELKEEEADDHCSQPVEEPDIPATI